MIPWLSLSEFFMNWKLKAHLMAVISRLPAADQIYHRLQQVAGTNKLHLDRDLERAFELVRLTQEAECSIQQASILEVGTGWRPLVPFVFALSGAKNVYTLDVNPWLTHEYALETWKALGTRLEQIAAEVNVPLVDIRERYRKVDFSVSDLHEFLGQINITYQYPGDARESGLPENSIDIVISSNVLEHIPLDVQTDIHSESLRILKNGGIAVHRFNPQDHYSTVDGKITNANFLRYSQKEWNWLGGSGLSYHNRLRAPAYRTMFIESGFDLRVCRERVDERSLKAIKSGELPLNAEFISELPRDLAVDYMWVVAQKPLQQPQDQPTSESSTETPSVSLHS